MYFCPDSGSENGFFGESELERLLCCALVQIVTDYSGLINWFLLLFLGMLKQLLSMFRKLPACGSKLPLTLLSDMRSPNQRQ